MMAQSERVTSDDARNEAPERLSCKLRA